MSRMVISSSNKDGSNRVGPESIQEGVHEDNASRREYVIRNNVAPGEVLQQEMFNGAGGRTPNTNQMLSSAIYPNMPPMMGMPMMPQFMDTMSMFPQPQGGPAFSGGMDPIILQQQMQQLQQIQMAQMMEDPQILQQLQQRLLAMNPLLSMLPLMNMGGIFPPVIQPQQLQQLEQLQQKQPIPNAYPEFNSPNPEYSRNEIHRGSWNEQQSSKTRENSIQDDPYYRRNNDEYDRRIYYNRAENYSHETGNAYPEAYPGRNASEDYYRSYDRFDEKPYDMSYADYDYHHVRGEKDRSYSHAGHHNRSRSPPPASHERPRERERSLPVLENRKSEEKTCRKVLIVNTATEEYKEIEEEGGEANSNSNELPCRTLFCRSVSKKQSHDKLLRLFEAYGELAELGTTNHLSRGIVFASYYDIRSSTRARQELDGKVMDGITMRVHFGKLPSWMTAEAPNKDHRQGSLLVYYITGRKEDPSDLEQHVRSFGEVKSVRDASSNRITKLIVEYYDSRSCLTALRALNDRSFGTGRLTAVLAWDYPRHMRAPPYRHSMALPIKDNNRFRRLSVDERDKNVQPKEATTDFYIDVKGSKPSEPAKPAISEILQPSHHNDSKPNDAVEEGEVLSGCPATLATKMESSASEAPCKSKSDGSLSSSVEMEIVTMAAPPSPKTATEHTLLNSSNKKSTEETCADSSPHLLAQMSSLLSSLQKAKKASPQKRPLEGEVDEAKRQEPSSISTGKSSTVEPSAPVVRAPGKKVAANRKEPSLESVQQLAKLLLQQTKTD